MEVAEHPSARPASPGSLACRLIGGLPAQREGRSVQRGVARIAQGVVVVVATREGQ
jgi:hypothetical protein